jgi:hypothetical protein
MADEKKGLNPLATGVAGAVIGAAAAAAAIALSDEKNRKKVEKTLESLQNEGNKVLKEITKRAMEIKDAVGKNSGEAKQLKEKSKK